MTAAPKLVSIAAAADRVPDGGTIAIGGPADGRRPLAILRALARRSWTPGALLAWAPFPEAALVGATATVLTPEQIAFAAPDVFLLHAAAADEAGDVLLDDLPDAWYADRAITRAAGCVVATVEQLVSAETVRRRPRDLVAESERVRAVVHTPFGAHPLGYRGRYPADPSGSLAGPDSADHWEYLNAVGFARLLHRCSLPEGEITHDGME